MITNQVHYGPDSDKTHHDVSSLADLHQWMQVGASLSDFLSVSHMHLSLCTMTNSTTFSCMSCAAALPCPIQNKLPIIL